ncbi:MAG: GNAT family N-acetyltransferase [Candidatus Moranbacteria bacterium]|jgi:ribosomal protein S18 acetylase RimI-like enzyme|nr:GNAT family N-acetyltransferase [Candidatus Moranbacteria bacterium]
MENGRTEGVPGKIRIVKMEKSDVPILLEYGKRHWKDEGWLTKEYLTSSFGQAGLSYVAKYEKKTIGGVILVYEDIVRNWIRYVIVDKEFRNLGVGGRLLATIFSHMKAGESVFVDTGVTDKKAIMFYEKMGFKNRGEVKSLYENKSAYIFEKVIR